MDSNFKKIDPYVLENFIITNFSTRQAFCDSIGRSDSWLHESLRRRSMSITDIMAIKGAHGIDVTYKEESGPDLFQKEMLLTLKEMNLHLKNIEESMNANGIGLFQIVELQQKILATMQRTNKPVAYISRTGEKVR